MPVQAAPPRDPRSIITPDAFDVSAELLGTPLASPSRRLAALLIDLAVIGLLILVTRSFALILGALVAILFLRVAFQRTPVRRSVFDRAMRLSVGCLGLVIGVATASIWAALSFNTDPGEGAAVRFTTPSDTIEVDAALAGLGFGDIVAGFGGLTALSQAEDRGEARDAVSLLVDLGVEGDFDADQIRTTIAELVGDDHRWSDELPSLLDEVLRDRGLEVAPDVTEASTEDSAAAAELDAIAGDTLRALGDRIGSLQGDLSRSEGRLAETRAQLEEANSGGLLSTLRGFVDELGFGFGWASLYLTVMLAWWNGQTIGKRLMGVRVIRLDGEPITWWVAFERGGGYAAGFATGLLGFAQVFWDGNRQAIHDRIVGTVVVREGAEKVGNWEEVL